VEKRNLHTLLLQSGCKLVQPLWKKIWRLLKNPTTNLPYNLGILLLGIYMNECEPGYYKGTFTLMFIAALFTIAKLWKQPRCSTTEEWVKKMWYLFTMEFYSGTKKNEILSLTHKWMELENIIFKKVSQTQKYKLHVLPHMLIIDLQQMQ
jgi:hypothetical protein